MAYTLPELGYAYNALEPHFDAQTLEIMLMVYAKLYLLNSKICL